VYDSWIWDKNSVWDEDAWGPNTGFIIGHPVFGRIGYNKIGGASSKWVEW